MTPGGHDPFFDAVLRARASIVLVPTTLALLRDAHNPEKVVQHPIDWADEYLIIGLSETGMEAVARVIHYTAGLVDEGQHRQFGANLGKAIPPLKERIDMEMITAEQQYEARGQLRVIERQLTRRFGALSTEHQQRLHSANGEQLDRYADELLTAQSIDDVFAAP